jgi:GNAT superfamily N-acetyltransferase
VDNLFGEVAAIEIRTFDEKDEDEVVALWERCGLGRTLMKEVERWLSGLGCPKVNLQIRPENIEAIEFYEQIGFARSPVLTMGKQLQHDER